MVKHVPPPNEPLLIAFQDMSQGKYHELTASRCTVENGTQSDWRTRTCTSCHWPSVRAHRSACRSKGVDREWRNFMYKQWLTISPETADYFCTCILGSCLRALKLTCLNVNILGRDTLWLLPCFYKMDVLPFILTWQWHNQLFNGSCA